MHSSFLTEGLWGGSGKVIGCRKALWPIFFPFVVKQKQGNAWFIWSFQRAQLLTSLIQVVQTVFYCLLGNYILNFSSGWSFSPSLGCHIRLSSKSDRVLSHVGKLHLIVMRAVSTCKIISSDSAFLLFHLTSIYWTAAVSGAGSTVVNEAHELWASRNWWFSSGNTHRTINSSRHSKLCLWYVLFERVVFWCSLVLPCHSGAGSSPP